MSLREDLRTMLKGRVAVVGVGNPDLGDDGAGLRLAEALADRGIPDVLLGERTPERWLGRLLGETFDTVLFLDAVEAGRPAGDAVLLDAGTVEARFPQVSTHRLSLGTLARLLGAERRRQVLLLGIQPCCLAPASGVSREVAATVAALADLLAEVLQSGADLGPRTSHLGHPDLLPCGEQP